MRKLFLIGLIISVASCKRDALTTYNADNSIYFDYKTDEFSFFDSLDFSFAYSSPAVTDTLIGIPLLVTGTFSDKDRPINIVVDPSSTAEQGKHYELSPVLFHSGKVADTFYIKLKRTDDLVLERKELILRLQSNESFKTDVKYKIARTVTHDTIDLLSFTIGVSDILTQGPYWVVVYEKYFGDFSLKKVRLINGLLGMPLDFWLDAKPDDYQRGLAVYYAATTSRYLSEQAAQGNPIYDEDGTEMLMGPEYQ